MIHACCGECWFTKHATKAAEGPPTRVPNDVSTCCWCGKKTVAGIYLRGDPKVVPCGGKGKLHADDPA
jgi:hypothetical protein